MVPAVLSFTTTATSKDVKASILYRPVVAAWVVAG